MRQSRRSTFASISVPGSLAVSILLFGCSGCRDTESDEIYHALSSPKVFDGSSDLQNLYTPCNLVVDKDGNLFILDMQQMKIIVLDSEGDYLYEFGGSGEGPGKFGSISFNFGLSSNGEVYAINNLNLIEVFSHDGIYSRRIQSGVGEVFDIAVADSNSIYISGHAWGLSLLDVTESPAVIQIDSQGEVVREYGHIEVDQRNLHERKLLLDCVMDIDEDRSVYYSSVSDYRVFKYDSLGALVWTAQGESSNEAFVVTSEESGSMLYPVIWDLVVSEGFVYVLWAQGGDDRGYRVDVFDSGTGDFTGYFFTGVPSETMNMFIKVHGDYFFTVDYDNAAIYRYNLSRGWRGD